MVVEWTYNEEARTPEGAEGCWRETSQLLVVTATHDLKNWCMRDVIGLEHGMCVEHGGALIVLQ